MLVLRHEQGTSTLTSRRPTTLDAIRRRRGGRHLRPRAWELLGAVERRARRNRSTRRRSAAAGRRPTHALAVLASDGGKSMLQRGVLGDGGVWHTSVICLRRGGSATSAWLRTMCARRRANRLRPQVATCPTGFWYSRPRKAKKAGAQGDWSRNAPTRTGLESRQSGRSAAW